MALGKRLLSFGGSGGGANVHFLLVAGGGSGGGLSQKSGGGGAGGLRTSYAASGGGGSAETPLVFNTGVTYTVTVGAGGANTNSPGFKDTLPGGTSSITGADITSISCTGGGGGGRNYRGGGYHLSGQSGGSGGGGNSTHSGGSGTANQGFAGSAGNTAYGGGGGGSAQAGGPQVSGYSTATGDSGDGNAVNILNATNANTSSVGDIHGSDVYYAGGGTGAIGYATPGKGGGVAANFQGPQGAGTPNTGAGGSSIYNTAARLGGSGVGILRLPTANYSGTTTGSPDVYTEGTDTVIVFKGTGTYTH
tara:strand:+ start:774 stop:1691 length:918 start_codon:yes stop_codon:yes gene_type:complete